MNQSRSDNNIRRILGRVARSEFVGRSAELERILAQASDEKHGRGLLVLMEPSAGVSELLRQAYDELFEKRSHIVPIYFAFNRTETTAVSAAIEFLNSFLQQYIAFRRDEPAFCQAALTLPDLVELAPAADLPWIEQLVDRYSRVRFSNDNKELVRFCLSVPQRVPAHLGQPFVMLDGAQLAEELNGSVALGQELLRVFGRSGQAFILAGLRRQIFDAAHKAECNFESLDLLRLEKLDPDKAHLLVDYVAMRQKVATSQESRDLLVQQFGGSPFFISSFLQAAHERNIALVSYRDCESLYVNELLGGHLRRHFEDLIDEMAPEINTRQALITLLWEAISTDEKAVSVEAWRKRLQMTSAEIEAVLHRLHIYEFVNWNGSIFDATTGPQTWRDYLKITYRLGVLSDPRALVVADSISDALKRAPHTMARHYKRLTQSGLREVLMQFDGQRIPMVLLDYGAFSPRYKGLTDVELSTSLESETELVKLPQTVHVASCVAFSSQMRKLCEEEKCVVAHAFEEGTYTDAHQVIWLVAEIEAKLEVGPEIAKLWHDRLATLAHELRLRRYKVWLISNEGFSEDACKVLRELGAYCSSKRQVEVLIGHIGGIPAAKQQFVQDANEFLLVVPMGEDNELLAASAVEQIARRLAFTPAAISQIKTAIVEACINASEHSYSPDRKIYQRFRVESDKLVVTISSRGVLPTNLGSSNAGGNIDKPDSSDERRGWGLKLIRTLMDEVEFERVDEGTSLRMTKYLRKT